MTPAPRRLFRLIYASHSTEPAAAMDETVRKVLIKSISNNRLVDVTGLLLVHRGWFLQALEGPEKSVRETFERIGKDPRHNAIAIVGEAYPEGRRFRDWNMCERRISVGDASLLQRFGQVEDFAPAALSADDALELLTTVGRSHAA